MEHRIRVLKCILDSRFGGPHRRSYALAERLRAEGIETVFLFGRKGTQPAADCPFEHAYLGHLQFLTRKHPALGFLTFLLSLPSNVARIERMIRSRQIDVVEVDGVTNLVPALAARRCRVPIVWWYNDHPPRPLGGLILRVVARLSATVVVQSERLKEMRTSRRPRLSEKTVVIHPAVDTRKFDPARYDATVRARLRAELGVPPGCPLIGTIGNLNRLKGHAYFIRAAARIRRRVPDAKFLVVGRRLDTNPGYWEHLQRLTAEHGLANDVIFAGFRDDIPTVLAALDVFVLSSIRESCPNVVLEAMAMQVPVVATDVGAVSELVSHGRTGLVVPPCDADATAEAVLKLRTMSQTELRAMTEAARIRVETQFQVDTIARQQLRIYKMLSLI